MTDPSPNPWDSLTDELDHWHQTGHRVRLWWRDDDAVTETDALNRLLECAAGHPLALAVVPGNLEPALVQRLAVEPLVHVLPHGLTHSNHQPPDQKKAEFGTARDPLQAIAEIRTGTELLAAAFGDQFQAIFVPPWNRITTEIAGALPGLGFLGLSTFGDRPVQATFPCLNTHIDILDWQEKRKSGRAAFIGEAAAVSQLTTALARRRTARSGTDLSVDPTEAVGLMTHHLDHDAVSWAFLARLIPLLDDHPAVSWIMAKDGL